MKLETPEFVLHASERLQALWHRKYGPADCIGTAAALVLCVGAVAVWAGGRGSNAASEVPEPSATPWVEPASDGRLRCQAAGVIEHHGVYRHRAAQNGGRGRRVCEGNAVFGRQ